MSVKEILVDIIVPLISGFIGGSIGTVVINNRKIKNVMNNKNNTFNNCGDVTNECKK